MGYYAEQEVEFEMFGKNDFTKALSNDGWGGVAKPPSQIGLDIKEVIRAMDNSNVHYNNNNALKTFICRFYKEVLGIEKGNRTPWKNYESILKEDRFDFELYVSGWGN